ncbi:MAG: acyltransferase [Alphaproteobacteria bacterium]|nr:acyltransferase [Alphaproteobacteria bacterium]
MIHLPKKSKVHLNIDGQNNYIHVNCIDKKAELSIEIHGDNNKIFIDQLASGKLTIRLGGADKVFNGQISFGKNIYVTDDLLCTFNEDNVNISVGDFVMFAPKSMIHACDGHTIFSKDNNYPLNRSYFVKIGNHCWIGREVLILKNSEIPDGCIVGARSIVNKKFCKKNCILVGMPAKVVKENVGWSTEPPNKYKPAK